MSTYIRRLSAKGLKSGDFDHQLDRVNLITGPSASGKSAILNAMGLAVGKATLLGRNNELKSDGSAIMALARNGHVSVACEDSQGRKNAFSWLAGKRDPKIMANEIPECPAALLDHGFYSSLSDKKKMEHVFSLYPMEDHLEFSGEAVSAAIQNIRPEESTEETERIRRELVAELDESDAVRHDCGMSIQDWLVQRVFVLRERLGIVNATAKRMTSAVAALTQISPSDLVPRNYRPEISQKREQLQKIAESLGSLNQSLADYQRKVVTRGVLERELPPEVPVPDVSQQVAALTAEIQTLNLPADDETSSRIARLTGEAVGLQLALQQHKSDTPAVQEAYLAARQSVIVFKEELQRCDREALNTTGALSEKLARPCCPECGAEGPELRERVLAAHVVKMDSLSAQRTAAEHNLVAAEQRLAQLKSAVEAAMLADKAIEDKRARIDELQREVGRLQQVQGLAARDRNQQIEDKRRWIVRLEGQVSQAEQANRLRNDTLKKIEILAEELHGWDVPELEQRRTDLTSERAVLQQGILDLEQKQRSYDNAKRAEQENAKILMEHQRARAEVTVLKLAIEKLEEIQGRMVAAAFDRILETVNRVTSSVMPEKIEYRDGVLGRWKGASFITHETFSGTEKALTYAGISLALAKDAPVRLVMIDELGRLDRASLDRFLDRMIELTAAGDVSQFVGCLSTAEPVEKQGVNCIAL